MPASSPYADDRKLAVRQRLWTYQQPTFDLVSWVLDDVVRIRSGLDVLDLGCGNGHYLHALRRRGARAVGLDVSAGMVSSTSAAAVVVADAADLPFRDAAFDVVLAPHMLYHVADRARALLEARRVLRSGGRFVAVTNGSRRVASVRALFDRAAAGHRQGRQRRDDPTLAFSLDNGAEQLRRAFSDVALRRPAAGPAVVVRDAAVVADYVDSLDDAYPDLSDVWPAVVADVRRAAQEIIDRDGQFVTYGDVGCFVCRVGS